MVVEDKFTVFCELGVGLEVRIRPFQPHLARGFHTEQRNQRLAQFIQKSLMGKGLYNLHVDSQFPHRSGAFCDLRLLLGLVIGKQGQGPHNVNPRIRIVGGTLLQTNWDTGYRLLRNGDHAEGKVVVKRGFFGA